MLALVFKWSLFIWKKKEILIKGSFDLIYYTQLHYTFSTIEFTTLDEGDTWSDAWYGDQITILPISERAAARDKFSFSLVNDALVFKIHSLSDNGKYERIVVAESMKYHFYLQNGDQKQ